MTEPQSNAGSCPLCGSPSPVLRELPQEFLCKELNNYFDEPLPAEVIAADYRLRKCDLCQFEFADPQVAGTAEFYNYLSRQPGYYPKGRWEWDFVRTFLTELKGSAIEVGSGDGLFLRSYLDACPDAVVLGVDTSPDAASCARQRGVDTVVADVRSLIVENPHYRGAFDVALAFHCLEHVSDPVGFVRGMLDCVHVGGSVFVSTPYSPMSLEVDWFDSLNHPPHHLTRWNSNAYEFLAKQLNCPLVLRLPSAMSVTDRALYSLRASLYGRRGLFSSKRPWLARWFHPLAWRRHLQLQRSRELINGQVAADVVLAEFQKT